MNHPNICLKKVISLIAVMLFFLVGCAEQSKDNQITIGILQYVEHDSLDQVREGFIEELARHGYQDGDNIQIAYQNASADTANLSAMSQQVTKDNDYILAIGTQVAQSIAGLQTDKSIYFSAISDPVGAGLVESLDYPRGQMTGTTDAGPLEEQIDLIERVYPSAQRVGLIYNSGEANAVSEMDRAKQIFSERGYDIVEKTVTSTNDVHSVMSSLVKESDAVFLVADNTIASSMPIVGSLAMDAGIGVFGGSADMVLDNGLATYGLDYRQLGQQTARMLIREIEEGIEPKDMPVETAEDLTIIVNEENAETLGIDTQAFEVDENGGQ